MPSRSPRTVSVIGVNGWYSANQRIAGGNVSVGTNPLPRNGSRISGIGRLLAVSTLLVTSPSATESQITARVTSVSSPKSASQSSTDADGRKPTSIAAPSTTTNATSVWISAPTTWPVSTDTRAIAIVRKRAMMPSVMSIATAIATPWAMPATANSRMPGVTYST